MLPTTSRRATRLIMAAVICLLAGCNTTPGVSNGSVDVCFRALPVGRAAIHDRTAKLIGVHRVPADKVRSHLPPSAQNELTAENDTSVCAMAFRDSFRAGQVDAAPRNQAGRYALVLVSSKKLHLIVSVVLDHLPRAFGGRTV